MPREIALFFFILIMIFSTERPLGLHAGERHIFPGDILIGLRDAIAYGYGTGELYEDEDGGAMHRVEVNRGLSLSVEYSITGPLAMGLTVGQGAFLWERYKEIDMAVAASVTYYITRPGTVVPFVMFEAGRGILYERDAVSVTRVMTFFEGRAGALVMIGRKAGVDLNVYYRHEGRRIKNELTGSITGLSAGLKYIF